MRKQYKPTYGFTLFLGSIYFMILMYLAFTPMLCINRSTNGISWIEIIGTFILFSAFFFILFLIINLISKIFTNHKVSVDENTIYYASDVIDFDNIREISYDCGKIGKNSSTPHSVIIMGKNKGYMHIERPSIMFLCKLISKCGNKFKINHIKRLIFLWPTLAFIGGIVIYFIIMFSN